MTLLLSVLTTATAWAWSGSGTTADPYIISSSADWTTFCDLLTNNTKGYFDGKTVKLDANIEVNRCAGSGSGQNLTASDHPFTGTFLGQGNTLTFNYGTAGTPSNEDYIAPFRYVSDATISGLHVSGNIYTRHTHAGGIIGLTYGTTTVTDCHSSVNIVSSINGDGTHGGILACTWTGSTTNITGCLFDGSIQSASGFETNRCGGFVGWRNNIVNVTNCLLTADLSTIGSTDSYTFVRQGDDTYVSITNSYYTTALGTEQGTKAIAVNKGYSEQVTPDYTTSGIKMRDGYMECDGMLYAPAGASVTVGYVDETGTTTTHSATVLGGGSGDTTLRDGWYVAGHNVSYSGGFLDFQNAETYLILADNANLNLTNKGSAINSSIALTIYAQANGTGSLTAESSSDGRGIFVNALTINGGNITVKSNNHQGIWAGTVTVNGGNVNATGHQGIDANDVTLNGGTVNATGTTTGISTKYVTTLAGATVTASSFASGRGYGPVTVADGFVYADGSGHYYGGTLSDGDKAAIAGQAISPVAAYSVSIADGIANGSVTVARSYAAAGENVILNVKPNMGYAVESVSYNDGSDHEITPVGDVYSFVMPATAVTVSATFSASTSFDTATDVSYIDADGMEQKAPTVNLLTSASTELLAGWYMAASDVTIDGNVLFVGDIHLILKDGVTLTINGELSTSEFDVDANGNFVGSDLTIYRQSAGTGRLTTSGIMAKTATVNGGVVTSAAGENSLGIFGKDIVINGGQVTATGNSYGIAAVNTITLGYSRADDFVHATSFPAGGATITIKDGQTLYDGEGGSYSGTLSSEQIGGVAGKTLRSYDYRLALQDIASNSTAIAGANGKVYNVTLQGRTLYKDGSWNTLCLPFDVTIADSPLAGDDVDVRTLSTSDFSDGTLTLTFTNEGNVTTMEAGKPYIIKWNNTGQHLTESYLVFTGVTVSSTTAATETDGSVWVDFCGTFSPEVIYESGDEKHNLYLGEGNTLYYPTTTDFKVNACRGYFVLKNGLTCSEPSSPNAVRAFNLSFGDNTETQGIMTTDYTDSTDKAGAWFDLQGRRVSESGIRNSGLKHGLYIHNGRKVVIK